MNSCPSCHLQFAQAGYVADESKPRCPNCGFKFLAPPLIKKYFSDLWLILTQPTRFFYQMPRQGGMAQPLVFALITHWLGEAMAYLWRGLMGSSTLSEFIRNFFQIATDVIEIDDPDYSAYWMETKQHLFKWFWGAGAIVIDPFITLIFIFFTSILVFIGARILVTPGKENTLSEISYESALRIVCFGMSPAILGVIPFFGKWAAALMIVIVTVIGTREVYQIGIGRAIVIALFPKLLYYGMFFLMFFVLAWTLLKFVFTIL